MEEKNKKIWLWVGIVVGIYVVASFVGAVPYEYNVVEKYFVEDDSTALINTKETVVYGVPDTLNLTTYQQNHIAIQFYQEDGFTTDITVEISKTNLNGVEVELVAMTNDWSVSLTGNKATFNSYLNEGDSISGLALEVNGEGETGKIYLNIDGEGDFDVETETINVII